MSAALLLDSVSGFGPQKFRALHDAGVTPIDVLEDPERLPMGGKTGEKLRAALSALGPDDFGEWTERAQVQLEKASECDASILLYGHPLYPANVFASNNPIPVLYVRGNPEILTSNRVVACVGSRDIAEPYVRQHDEFARTACLEGFTIASGFAMGADTIGHRAARDVRGRTICVMPNGLDHPFPPENRGLWEEFLSYEGAVMITEFQLGRRADALTLRKRNKLIVASALGVLVSQSSAKGGAMNAYRFGLEQRKPIATFAPDGTDRTSGNALIATDEKAGRHALGGDGEGWTDWLGQLCS